MKTRKYFVIALSFLALGVTSCKDMLEEENFGRPTVGEMMKNEENIISLVGQAYADLKFVHDHWGYWGVNTLTADEGLCPTRALGDWNDSGYWKNLNTHNWNVYGEAFKSIWNRTVAGAVLCNNLLQTLDDAKGSMDPDLYAMYTGELEVLRSYYYYMLFDCFGRIPYMEDYSDRVEELMEPATVWAHLVACLERNAPNMAEVNGTNRPLQIGRATRGVAYTLLARLYLNAESFGCTPENVMAAKRTVTTKYGEAGACPLNEVGIKINSTQDFYTNAARCCDEVIKSGSYSIMPNYFDNYLIDNSASTENILVIPEDGTTNNVRDVDKVKNKLQISFLTLHYCHQTLWPKMQDKPWNGFCARPDYLKMFNDYDVRGCGYENDGTHNKKQWAWFVGPIYGQGVDTVIVDANKSCTADSVVILTKEITSDPEKPVTDASSLSEAIRTSGARLIKYQIDTAGVYRYCENDFVLLRYADVILMKKEAIARGGITENAGIEDADYKAMKKRAFAYSDSPESAYDAAYPDAGEVTNDLMTGILAERGRELSWECARRRDLIRFGQFENVQYVTNKAAARRWFPIPFAILQKSSLKPDGTPYWTQNEGY